MKGETRFPLYYSNISLEHLFHLFAQFDRSTNLIEIRWVFYPFESDNHTRKHFIHVRNLSILFINRHAVQYLEKLTVRC
jgi:hypothetical protein